jgi:hypothetical protein
VGQASGERSIIGKEISGRDERQMSDRVAPDMLNEVVRTISIANCLIVLHRKSYLHHCCYCRWFHFQVTIVTTTALIWQNNMIFNHANDRKEISWSWSLLMLQESKSPTKQEQMSWGIGKR